MRLLFAFALIVALVAAGCLWVIRPHRVPAETGLPEAFPEDGFSHEPFEALLKRYVDDHGRVDYESWFVSGDSRQQLADYLGAVAAFSPDNAPATAARC